MKLTSAPFCMSDLDAVSMAEELLQNYDELYHEEVEYYNPEGYSDYLDGLSDEELLDLYRETFGDLDDDVD